MNTADFRIRLLSIRRERLADRNRREIARRGIARDVLRLNPDGPLGRRIAARIAV